jgi:hypothetical protein
MKILEPDSLHADTVNPGVNLSISLSPLINHASFRIILIDKLIWGLEASMIDAETAFCTENRLKKST